MFKRISKIDKPVTIYYEDQAILAQEGDTVAAALIAIGVLQFRQTSEGQKRGPYCMIGNCYECLVEIDGQMNMQACQYRVLDKMHIRKQRGYRSLGDGADA